MSEFSGAPYRLHVITTLGSYFLLILVFQKGEQCDLDKNKQSKNVYQNWKQVLKATALKIEQKLHCLPDMVLLNANHQAV